MGLGSPLKTAVKLGPGLLYIAAIGTTEPTTLTGALPAAWVALGYTEDGHSTSITVTQEPVFVAEEIDPIRQVKTQRSVTLELQMAEITARNLQLAMNGGTISSPTGGYVTFTPPTTAAAQVAVMIVWQADDNQERWLWRECYAGGDIAIPRRKAADSASKAVIPITFDCVKPAGAEPFHVWFAEAMAGV